MKNVKKISLVLIAVMIALSLFGCTRSGDNQPQPSPTPGSADTGNNSKPQDLPPTFTENGKVFYKDGTRIAEEKITLKGYGSKFSGNAEWDDNMLVWKELENRTNIRIEWETVVNTEARTKALTYFAANDLPDVFMKNALNMTDVSNFSKSGHLADFKQYMDSGLMPNFSEAYKDVNVQIAITDSSGKIYALPAYYTDTIDTVRRFMYINETWLKNVGKEKPKTIEQFYDVLRAFKNQDANGNGDANDEYPLAFGEMPQTEKTARALAGIDDVFAQPYNVINGELHQMYTSENMKDAFVFLRTLYREGLMEQDIFTLNASTFFARIENNQYGVTLLLPPADSSQFGILEPSFGIKGKESVIWNWKVSPVLGASCFNMTTSNKYPQATARWIDYLYGEEGATLVRMGVEGDTYKVNADGSLSYTDKVKKDEQGIEFAMAKYSFWLGPNSCPGRYTSKQTLPLFEDTLTPKAIDIFAPYYTKHSYSLPQLEDSINKERTTLQGEINKYYSESRAAFITGNMDIESQWDQYVSTLKRMNIDRLEEIYRQAYSIVKSKMN